MYTCQHCRGVGVGGLNKSMIVDVLGLADTPSGDQGGSPMSLRNSCAGAKRGGMKPVTWGRGIIPS